MLTISPAATMVAREALSVASQRLSTNAPPRPSRIPFSLPSSQLYYWTRRWQEDEAEAVDELARGEGHLFTDTAEALRWLLSDED
ncbi:MAG: hypothetical protein ACRDZO_20945 [Egibacteraceae bacterium]